MCVVVASEEAWHHTYGVELRFDVIVGIEFLSPEIDLLGNHCIEQQACRFSLESSRRRKDGSRGADFFMF